MCICDPNNKESWCFKPGCTEFQFVNKIREEVREEFQRNHDFLTRRCLGLHAEIAFLETKLFQLCERLEQDSAFDKHLDKGTKEWYEKIKKAQEELLE